MNGFKCSCDMWLTTRNVQVIHNRPFSRNGVTTSEHKKLMDVKHLIEVQETVESIQDTINSESYE